MPAQLADPPRATRPGAGGALRGRVGAPRLCGVKRTESKPEQESELALLARLRAGDDSAFGELVEAHLPRLLVVTRRLLGNEEDARDAVQEAFLSAFKSLERFEGGSRLATWLHRIAVNAALMKLRARRRREELGIDELLPRFAPDGHHAEPPRIWDERKVDEALERTETCAVVRAAIARLPESFRTVLMLCDLEGLENGDVARLLGVSTNAVAVRLHRARQALRTLLDEHFREDLP
ncbi:MAG: sigma-70 family RNA polymerase sigma factor [Planctomycetes bacterium]|nr:sigma-70 family RNA polymerase sigma factor [Planctomycetota bacterium]